MQQSLTYSLRLAARGLLRARGTTIIAMLTLGIGIAAAVALLGVVDSGVRALPVPGGGDVVELEVRNARAERLRPPVPIDAWASAPGVLEAGAVRQMAATLTHPDHAARRTYGAAMHPSVFALLRMQPALGRLPTTDPADATSLVLGWDTFREFGGDAALVGAQLAVDGVAHTVIGVMPDGFGFPENQSFWTVLPAGESGEVVARLAPGTARDVAAAALAVRLDALASATGAEGAPHRVTVQRWTNSRDGDGEVLALAALAVLVALLLLVCCANVATLLLVRGTERSGVLAVQSALGASRAHVTLQLLLESGIIAVGGGAVGLAGGFAMLRWMQLNLSAHWGYYWMAMEVRTPVLLGTVALVVVTALVAGTVPALRASRVDLAGLLVGHNRGGDRRQRNLGRWFVGAQVALSSLGLIAAVYLAFEFASIGRITERLPLDDVITGELTLPPDAYADAASRAALVGELRGELRRMPGVRDVSISGAVPGGGGRRAVVHVDGAAPGDAPVNVEWIAADAALTSLYGMRLVAGQTLPQDDHGSARVVLVTTGFARRYLDGAAVGARLRLDGVHSDGEWADVIGVVDDWFPDRDGVPRERVIVPLAHAWSGTLYVSLAAATDPDGVLAGVRAAVRRVDARVPVESLQTLRARMNWFLRMGRVIAGFGMLGGAGSALIAAIGLYGVMSFQVRARRREIGVRMAVGAARRRILLEVLRDSVLRVAPGAAVGVAVALGTVPVIASRVGAATAGEGVPPLWLVAAFSAATLLLIGAAAALEPALRAARLDPQDVLRSE